MPYANEIGLRMLIGGAVREASVLGYHVLPLFSYYSYHGPVFRILLRVTKGKLPEGRFPVPWLFLDLYGQDLFTVRAILQKC